MDKKTLENKLFDIRNEVFDIDDIKISEIGRKKMDICVSIMELIDEINSDD